MRWEPTPTAEAQGEAGGVQQLEGLCGSGETAETVLPRSAAAEPGSSPWRALVGQMCLRSLVRSRPLRVFSPCYPVSVCVQVWVGCVHKCQCESHPEDVRGNFEADEVQTPVTPTRTWKPRESSYLPPPCHPLSTQVTQGHLHRGTPGPGPPGPRVSVAIGQVRTCCEASGPSCPLRS